MDFQIGNKINQVWKILHKGEYTVRPFEVYKKWELNTLATHQNYFKNYGIEIYRALYPENHTYIGNVVTISSSLYHRSFTTQSYDPKMLWYHADYNLFADHENTKYPTIMTEFDRELYLAESSSMMIIPQKVFGEGIRKGSFKFSLYNTTTGSLNYNVYDDSRGNIIDSSFDKTKFVDSSYLLLSVGFNEKYREYEFRNKLVDYVLDTSNNRNNVSIINSKYLNYYSGIPTTDTTQSSGVSAALNGAFFQVKEKDKFNFNYKRDFAFSFWVNVPPTQSNQTFPYNWLFNKNRTIDGGSTTYKETGKTAYDKMIHGLYDFKPSPQYPFDITVHNSTSATPYRITLGQSSGLQTQEIMSSSPLTTGSWHHIVCQKTSSIFQIWIDGTLDTSVSSSITANVTNDNSFFIGGNGTTDGMFSGSLDEIRIYNKGLTSQEISYLGNNSFANGYAYQTNRVGNIFYKSGTVVISDPRPKYANAFLGETGNYDYNGIDYGFTGSFRSTTTFYEHEIICKIRKNEFNFTTNPSVYKDKDPYATQVEDYVTSSLFNPYITTIGLYNDNHDLVAVGKLASPLEKRDDVDINVIVRFDV